MGDDRMKPYYEDDWATIYHGDSREIVPGLPRPELVVTDPPYGMSYASGWRRPHDRLGGIVGDDEQPAWVFDLCPSVALLCWCRWNNLRDMPPPSSLIVWDKLSHGMGDLHHEYGRRWEACAFYPGPDHQWGNGRPVDVIRIPRVPPSALVHPTEKPADLMQWLIGHHPGDVLDPFMGSGPTLVAAKNLGRNAVGIDISEHWCEVAAQRLSQEVLKL